MGCYFRPSTFKDQQNKSLDASVRRELDPKFHQNKPMAPFGCCLSILPFRPVVICHHGDALRRAMYVCSSRAIVCVHAKGSKRLGYGAVLPSFCSLQPIPRDELMKPKELILDNVEIFSLAFQKSDVRSMDKYIIQEATLDEEYWAAAWLRAQTYFEEQSFCRYIENYCKRFAEQEFMALKRRCFGRQGVSIKCTCLIATTPEDSIDSIGKFSEHTLRDRMVGTLDISARQLLRGEVFPRESPWTSQLMFIEPERRCGYIANVCVAKSARRKGIASSLLETAIEIAKGWRLKDLYVHVNLGNIAARSLYMKSGFKVVEDYICQSSTGKAQLLYMYI